MQGFLPVIVRTPHSLAAAQQLASSLDPTALALQTYDYAEEGLNACQLRYNVCFIPQFPSKYAWKSVQKAHLWYPMLQALKMAADVESFADGLPLYACFNPYFPDEGDLAAEKRRLEQKLRHSGSLVKGIYLQVDILPAS